MGSSHVPVESVAVDAVTVVEPEGESCTTAPATGAPLVASTTVPPAIPVLAARTRGMLIDVGTPYVTVTVVDAAWVATREYQRGV